MAGSPHASTTIDVPVLIVGAGPVGLLGGLLLAAQGHRALVVERRDGPQRAPAAHVVNARTFEICRQAGLDMAAIEAAAQDPADAGHVNFVTRLAGELIGRLPFERQGDECRRFTPTPLRNLSQHRFEPLLADELRGRDGVELRYAHRWESSVQDADGVTSIVTDLTTGDRLTVRSRFVVGCDGAGSPIRKSLGIEMEGPPRIESFVMVHFEADLRPIVEDRPGVLHFVMDPAAGGALVAHDVDREWVYMHAFDPDAESLDDFDEQRCRDLVLRAIDADVDLTVLDRGTWHMSCQVANGMRDGRIFLAGDAAHRFPPTGGLGLNTGVADVHGLVWRLVAALDGWGGEALLDTYAVERLPVASTNGQASLENAFQMVLLAAALGIDEVRTTAAMRAALDDPGRRAAIDDAVQAQATHFDMLGLQLGYVYGSGAIAGGGPDRAEADPVRDYEPTGAPGARLPHAWIDGESGRSTLDVVEPGRFALVSWGDHDRWAAAAAVMGAPVDHRRVGTDLVAGDAWRSQCGVGPTGALLVRPDQHVGWRAVDSGTDPSADLAAALAEIVGS